MRLTRLSIALSGSGPVFALLRIFLINAEIVFIDILDFV